MVTLSFFRHAKSAWDQPGLSDFERALAPRGENAAPRMGRYMAENDLEPEIVLCSTAKRASQTLELALPEFKSAPEVRYVEALYHAGSQQMFELVRKLPETCSHAMLVGHNPGMHALAFDLTGSGDEALIHRLGMKFPTAALATINFDGGWDSVMPGDGKLSCFMVPRELP